MQYPQKTVTLENAPRGVWDQKTRPQRDYGNDVVKRQRVLNSYQNCRGRKSKKMETQMKLRDVLISFQPDYANSAKSRLTD